MNQYEDEIRQGERFEFGANWGRFLRVLDDARIAEAERSLRENLSVDSLAGRRFVDVGSGSGLFSLAARRLGASVHSFDFDPQSVACTQELRRRYFADDAHWTVDEASALDRGYLSGIGTFDIVYSWGVLHHTGAMWQALDNVASLVSRRGTLFIAIYNDQGRASRLWLVVKKAYNRLPPGLRWLVVLPSFVRLWGPTTVRDLMRGKPGQTWREVRRNRGMTPWRDVIDWVGGYPFEVASPEVIFDFYRDRGFTLRRLKTRAGGHGCNEFVFSRDT